MFLFQFVKHIIETVIEIYEILLIWWVDPKYPWSQGIGSAIWGSSMTRVKYLPFWSIIVLCILYSKVLFSSIAVPLAVVDSPAISTSIFQSSHICIVCLYPMCLL